ncbi:MAG: integration host factor subunit beta [Deltaproteobacteria bacterium]|jgi:integration host factor subunit beta|nr:integration host factor subunit beta [Deltaproteobacteria bacterium]
MNKSQLIESVASKSGVPVKETEVFISSLFSIILKSLAEGERTEIRGFGSFKVKHYKAYIGRNPKSGLSIAVKAKKLPTFKAGKALKDMVDPREP